MLNKIEQRGRERDEAETISRTYQSHLERLTNELEERVKERTIELQESYNNLQNMQAQLIESEKMSALGNLVAGVAHEVNTPLGISITAASIFKNEIKSIKDMLDENRLSKTALLHFIDTIIEADEILIKNLDRAALLVKNFKKISVDQSSEELRDFELNSYLKEVVSTFKSELKHRPIELDLQLEDESINMFSYPGAISQIVVNMLQNALLHAFDFDQEGKIILETHQDDKNATIIFADNGKGIDSAVVDKVFEPFITTKRNEGGTGLGLNITYNLITQKLAGNIHLDTEYKDGARFVITVPLNITENEVEAI
jgi:signal transduction histidine kinase